MFVGLSLGLNFFLRKKSSSLSPAQKREARVQACYDEIKEKSARVVDAMARRASGKVTETFTRQFNKELGKEAEFLESGTGRTLMELFSSRFAQFTLKQVVHDQLQEKVTNKAKTKYEHYIAGKTPEEAAEGIVAELTKDIEEWVRAPRSGFSQSMVDFTECVIRNLPVIFEGMPLAEQKSTAAALKAFFVDLSEDLRELANVEGDISGEMIGTIFAQNLSMHLPNASSKLMRFMGQCIQEMRLSRDILQGVSSDAVSRVVTDDPESAAAVRDDIEFFKNEVSSLFSNFSKDALRECADIIDQKLFQDKIPYFKCTLAEFLDSPLKQWLARKLLTTQWVQKKLIAKLNAPDTEAAIQEKIARVTRIAKKVIAKMVANLPNQEAIKEDIGRLERGVKAFSFAASSNHRGHVVEAATEAVRELKALPAAFKEREEAGEVHPAGEVLKEIAAPVQRLMKKVADRTEAAVAPSMEQNQSWGSWLKSWVGY